VRSLKDLAGPLLEDANLVKVRLDSMRLCVRCSKSTLSFSLSLSLSLSLMLYIDNSRDCAEKADRVRKLADYARLQVWRGVRCAWPID
jgi:hypothetical protein